MRLLDGARRLLLGRTKTKPRERLAAGEIGWGGAKVFGGLVLDEYNPDLKGKLGLQTAEKMRRTSGQVRAVERVYRLPIESTQWFVKEPKGAGTAEKEATELLGQDLFDRLERPWTEVIREGCLAGYFGVRFPEIVWQERDGRLALRDVASRNPELVERWVYDENGKLIGYVYAGQKPVGGGKDPLAAATSAYERVFIPLEKTVHFGYDRDNDSPTGFGLWRSTYPHWYFVQAIYKIMGIGIERNLLGVPVGSRARGRRRTTRPRC